MTEIAEPHRSRRNDAVLAPGTRSQAVVPGLHDGRQPGSFLSEVRELIED